MPRIINIFEAQRMTQPTVFIVLVEHLGDIIACEPVIRYAKKIYPAHNIAWITREQYFEILTAHPLLDWLVPADKKNAHTVEYVLYGV